jgi:hypothetical protein
MLKPRWLGVIRARVVAPLQIGHSGRKDMVTRLDEARAHHSQSPVRCHDKADDGSMMARRKIARCSVLHSFGTN